MLDTKRLAVIGNVHVFVARNPPGVRAVLGASIGSQMATRVCGAGGLSKTGAKTRPRAQCPEPEVRAHCAASLSANFGFKGGTGNCKVASVLSIPKFASSVRQGVANFGIGTLAPVTNC